MRFLVWLVIVVAAVGGALFGVGYYFLPNTLDVTRTAAIDRPRATIYAMAEDLRIFREWSPFYARDPDAEYSFSDDPGAGQSMRWTSRVRDVGSGRMTIVRVEPNREVESIIELYSRATLSSRFVVQRAPRGSSVAWSVSAACQPGAVNVPCRYMNLVLASAIRKDIDAGLARLKTLADQLLDVDFEGVQPEFLRVEAKSYVFVEASTSSRNPLEVDQALDQGKTQVRDFMTAHALTPTGPLLRATTNWDQARERMGFRVGFPFQGAIPLVAVGVQIGETPSGQAMRVVHTGRREDMPMTYRKAYAYLQAHRIALRQGGLPWEVVDDDSGDDPAAPSRIEIYIPLQ